MFNNLKKLLKHSAKATLIIKGDEQQLSIAVFTDPKESGIPVKPIVISGTYAEVEKEFDNALDLIFAKNDTLLTNTRIVAEGIKKAAEEKTKKVEAKKVETKKTTSAPVSNDLFGQTTESSPVTKEEPKEEIKDDDDDNDNDNDDDDVDNDVDDVETNVPETANTSSNEDEEIF